MMNFEDAIRRKILKKVTPNESRARSLIEESERKNNSLKKILTKIGLEEENSNDVIEYCYDILISLIRSKLYSEGFKSSGEGSHEAEISYLRKIGFSDSEVITMDELRKFRNEIKYYGKRFSKDYAQRIVNFMNSMVSKLKEIK